ncbi:MAG: T9SS type A sorting domain-containing protein [Bacteroidales bacterium]|nr:MAG: T9SS type A sorting domain-containing protein [Bacteroidales bacterium]
MKKFGFTIIMIVVFSIHATCQYCKVYTTSNSDLPYYLISALASDSQGNIWIGTGNAFGNGGGVAKFDGENWTIYNTSNSDLPFNMIGAILPEIQGGVWIGTSGGVYGTRGGGLAYLKEDIWTIYDTANSELPDNDIVELIKDNQGSLWIGTFGGGLAKFDGSNWIVYDKSNSDLPNDDVFGLAFDKQENLWVGTFGGLAMFDGENWTVYNTSNSDLPHNYVYDLAFDSQGVLWIGTAYHISGPVAGGLARFDGENWTVYNTSNSILPHNDVYDIKIDDQDNVWIGCGDHIPSSVGGLLKFDGTDWTLYDKTNSRIPYNLVYTLTIDPDGNIWTGSVNHDEQGGLACVDPGTVTSVDKRYAIPGIDSVLISIKMSDPTNNTLLAEIEAPDQILVDSLQLFDDGNHNDGNAGDSLYANIWPVSYPEERKYYVDLFIRQVDTDTIINHMDNMTLFTTKGPVVLESYTITSSDTIPNPGNRMIVKLTLKNNGTQKPVRNIKARLLSLDSLVDVVINMQSFDDMAPGETVQCNFSYSFDISEDCLPGTDIPFELEISEDEYVYWYDTFSIMVETPTPVLQIKENIPNTFSLKQNFPNPFNTSTTIEYNLPKSGNVNISIYNLSGERIKVLNNSFQNAGSYEIQWNGRNDSDEVVSSGFYFLELNCNDYRKIIQMIFLKD